jgi:type IV secretion system protein VirB9
MRLKVLIVACLCVPVMASAELTPPRGDSDPRVRMVDYDPSQVVRIVTFYGVSTHVQFADNEQIKDVAVGDDQAWSIVPRGNHLFIKPKAKNADTNVTVVTDRRTYHFALIVQTRPPKDAAAWRDPNLVFSLSFRYPDAVSAGLEATSAAKSAAARRDDLKAKLAKRRSGAENLDYWVAGSPEISPSAARDDGRFVYLTFSDNRDMPAVYSVGDDGHEALVNTSVEGNEIVVQRLIGKLTLRKGDAAACVVNRSFELDAGKDNSSGTITPEVQRVIKEVK